MIVSFPPSQDDLSQSASLKDISEFGKQTSHIKEQMSHDEVVGLSV
jgi:hypothetical protein